VALILACAAIPYYWVFGLISTRLSYPIVGIVGLLVLAIGFNYFNRQSIARWLVIVVANLTLLFYSSSLGKDAHIQLVYFALMAFPFVIFDPEKKGILHFLLYFRSSVLFCWK